MFIDESALLSSAFRLERIPKDRDSLKSDVIRIGTLSYKHFAALRLLFDRLINERPDRLV